MQTYEDCNVNKFCLSIDPEVRTADFTFHFQSSYQMNDDNLMVYLRCGQEESHCRRSDQADGPGVRSTPFSVVVESKTNLI